MAKYLARSCPKVMAISESSCENSGATCHYNLSTGTASNAITGWLGLSSKASRLPLTTLTGSDMLDPQKSLEREALLKRHRELQAEIAQPTKINVCGLRQRSSGTRALPSHGSN
jgi:hypothetical protein